MNLRNKLFSFPRRLFHKNVSEVVYVVMKQRMNLGKQSKVTETS